MPALRQIFGLNRGSIFVNIQVFMSLNYVEPSDMIMSKEI